MQDWNPALYLRFANERTRPAAELLARVPSSLHSPARSLRIVDLGCGPGNISFRLARRWPEAEVLGVDGAAAMLQLAEAKLAGDGALQARVRFERACLPAPQLAGGYSAVVSNSLLHHLQNPAALWTSLRLFGSQRAVVVIRDLRRPQDPDEQEALVQRYAGQAPDLLRRDFRHSLAAAYRPDEVEAQLQQAGLEGLRVEARDDRYLDVSGLLS